MSGFPIAPSPSRLPPSVHPGCSPVGLYHHIMVVWWHALIGGTGLEALGETVLQVLHADKAELWAS